jgi:acyl-CoA synthetase (AMP-forming)/AMP-acid ligase II
MEQHFLDRLKATSEQTPHKKAIQVVDRKCAISETITYAQLWNQTGLLAAHYTKKGLQKGDRVMIIYPNTAQTVLVLHSQNI